MPHSLDKRSTSNTRHWRVQFQRGGQREPRKVDAPAAGCTCCRCRCSSGIPALGDRRGLGQYTTHGSDLRAGDGSGAARQGVVGLHTGSVHAEGKTFSGSDAGGASAPVQVRQARRGRELHRAVDGRCKGSQHASFEPPCPDLPCRYVLSEPPPCLPCNALDCHCRPNMAAVSCKRPTPLTMRSHPLAPFDAMIRPATLSPCWAFQGFSVRQLRPTVLTRARLATVLA